MAEIKTLAFKSDAGAYYRFSGNSNDSVNSNNGTDTDISYVSGKYGQAADFNGTTSKITVTAGTDINNIFDGGGAITVWLNPDTAGEGGFGYIAFKNWILNVEDLSGGNLKITFIHNFSTARGKWTTTSRVLPTGSFSSFVLNYNNSSTSNNPTIYIDASSVAVTEAETPSGTRTADTSDALVIGNRAAQDRTFEGIQDDFALFSRVLTTDEITAIYEAGNTSNFFMMF